MIRRTYSLGNPVRPRLPRNTQHDIYLLLILSTYSCVVGVFYTFIHVYSLVCDMTIFTTERRVDFFLMKERMSERVFFSFHPKDERFSTKARSRFTEALRCATQHAVFCSQIEECCRCRTASADHIRRSSKPD